MRISSLLFTLLVGALLLRVQALQPAAPATETSQTQSTPSQHQAVNPAADGTAVAVDAAKVTGSTFESQYFKFTYELPKSWKALDDASRVAANQLLLQEDREREKERAAAVQKGGTKVAEKKDSSQAKPAGNAYESYSLMVAGPNGVESLQSPVLPRINVWANRRVPPLDRAADHVQFLMANKRSRALVRSQEVAFDGHTFVRGEVITPNGNYQAQYVTVIGDYLVGFDFRAESEREMVEMAETMKTIKFH
ncbi:MAG: hypothetical protein WA628_01315 [Terriglobales bacterium]